MTDLISCFELLGVSPSVSAEEVKRAYYDLVREWHPDRLQHDPCKRRTAEARLKEINVAYGRVRAYLDDPAAVALFPPARSERRSRSRQEFEQARRDRAQRLHEQGEAHFNHGRWEEAVSALLQSVCLVGRNPDAYFTLGLAYRVQNQAGRAASAFRQVVRLQPDRTEAYLQLAQLYLEMGEYRETLAACAQSLRRNPPDAELLAAMGGAYRMLNRRSQAMESLREALRIDPRSVEAQFQMGMTLLEQGNREGARRQAQALRDHSSDHAARLLIAIADSGKRATWFK